MGNAERFFLNGMTDAMHRMAGASHPAFPVTIYYAYKQGDTGAEGTASTGWETFLEAVIRAGFSIVGTWPMRTENATRLVGMTTNALASSIVLVCRPRAEDAPEATQRAFLSALERELPEALDAMLGGEAGRSAVAPVDLSQAVIGPGIGLYSKYAAVLKATGERMDVREALQHINRAVDEVLERLAAGDTPGGVGTMDADTRFALDWFKQYGFDEARFGDADVLARSKSTSVDSVAASGIAVSGSGKVRLLRPSEYPADWSPVSDARMPVWEVLHHLVRALGTGGVEAAGAIVAQTPEKQAAAKALAYRLYSLCERMGRAPDAGAYNGLIASWPLIAKAASERPRKGSQGALFDV